MRYYGYKGTNKIWKQKEPLKENPSSIYPLFVFTKKEAKALAKQKGIEILTINLKSSKMAKDKKSKKKDKKGKKEQKKTGSADAKVVRKLDGSIALSKLQHVRMKKKGKKGKVDCLVIPIDANFLYEQDGAVYLGVSINLKDGEDQYGQHGFIGQKVDARIYKEASDKQKEKMKKTPILGGVKDWEFSSTSNDTGGSKGEVKEEDDLPF